MKYQRIVRIGNALGIVIPAKFCRDFGIHRNDYVTLRLLEAADGNDPTNYFYLEVRPVIDGSVPVDNKTYA